MLDEKLPHQVGSADFTRRAPYDPFRQDLAARPSVAPTINGVENHVCVLSAVRVNETADAREIRVQLGSPLH